MDLNLKGRVAVVTGAGAGIGEAIAGALASEGCSVWLADRDRAAATSAAAALSSHATGMPQPLSSWTWPTRRLSSPPLRRSRKRQDG